VSVHYNNSFIVAQILGQKCNQLQQQNPQIVDQSINNQWRQSNPNPYFECKKKEKRSEKGEEKKNLN